MLRRLASSHVLLIELGRVQGRRLVFRLLPLLCLWEQASNDLEKTHQSSPFALATRTAAAARSFDSCSE